MTRNKRIIFATIAAITLVAAVLVFVRLRSRAGEHAESLAEPREHGEEREAGAKSVRLSQEALEAAHLEVVRVTRGRLSRDIVLPTIGGGMALWREKLFAQMHHNASGAAAFLNLPNNSVVELGSKIEI